jgi:hypothetical protein
MKIPIPKNLWSRVAAILRRSSWMRFSLSFSRGQWGAVFFHENGRLYGSFSSIEVQVAVSEAVAEAERKTAHLIEGKV